MLKLGTQNIAALHLGGAGIQKAYLGEAVVFGAGKPSRLPEGYTEVEYIKSSGTQYINLMKAPNSNIAVTIDFSVDSTPAGEQTLFGNYFKSYGSTTYYQFRCMAYNGNIQVNVSTRWTIVANTLSPGRHNISLDVYKKQVIYDGTSTSIDTFSIYTQRNMGLFAAYYSVNNESGWSTYCSMNLYSCQISEKDVLTMDLVPCIDPTGAVGLYDLVEGKFYGNAGTGAFTAGPAV